MKKDGYTLVELLGILAVMAVMLLIIVPNVISTVRNADIQKQEIFAKTIEQAAENYVENNIDLFPELNKSEVTFRRVQELIDAGYLKSTLIDPATNEKIDGNSYFSVSINSDMTKNYVYLKDAKPVSEIADQLLANNTTYTYMGGTYLKGKISNNYIWYNGFIWRIMGKNADESIRLITEENVTAIPWGASKTAKDYNNSYIKDWVNNYFLPRLKDTSKIVSTSFCEDSTLVTSSSSRTTCSNPVSAQAGILSLDEYNLAGGRSSYLQNYQYYYTLTPYNEYNAWGVYGNGLANYYNVTNVNGVRAVISISSDAIITSGNGTLTANSDTEYVAGQTLDNVTGTLSSKARSGEYVKFDGRLYRIVEHTGEGTKLILDGFYDTDTAYDEDFADMSTLLTSSSFLNWLAPTRQAYILNTTWYRGDYWTGGDYKTNLTSTSNPFTNKVGLIRVGEMLASQSLSLLTSNYSKTSSSSNTKHYWTLTSNSASYAWFVLINGYPNYVVVTTAYGVRPVIVINSSTNIIRGNGTMSNPYRV